MRESSAKEFPVNTLLVAMYGQGQTRGRTGVLGLRPPRIKRAAQSILTRMSSIRSFFNSGFGTCTRICGNKVSQEVAVSLT